jgi:hypothetical protein
MAAMKTPAWGLAALAAAGCASVVPVPFGSLEPPESLAAAETAFAAHSVREDMRAAFLASFHEDGVFVRQGWTQVARSGDLGYTRGSYAAANAPAAPLGAFLRAWRLEGGDWRIALDVTHPAT